MRKLFYLSVAVLCLLVGVSSCKKPGKGNTQPTPPAGAVQLWSNITYHIVDSTQWVLEVNGTTPANGIYNYTFTPSSPYVTVNVGDILIGTANGGYLRKVTAISYTGKYYSLQTQPASMADVFKSGSFSFQIPFNDPSQQAPGISRSFSKFGLFLAPGFNFDLVNSTLALKPVCNFSFTFDSVAGLTDFKMWVSSAAVNDSVTFNISGVGPYDISNDTTLSNFSSSVIEPITAWTPNGNVTVPVVVKLLSAITANTTSVTHPSYSDISVVTAISKGLLNSSVEYSNGSWQPLHSYTSNNFIGFDTFSNPNYAIFDFAFSSSIASYFYNVAGPQINIGFSGDEYITSKTGATVFQFRTDLWNTGGASLKGQSAIGKGIPDFSESWTTDSVFYITPYQLTIISGNNDTVHVATPDPNPLEVKITDSNGNAVSGVSISFSVTSGHGTISASNVTTDQNGLAKVNFVLGPTFGNQTVTANCIGVSGQPIKGAPAVFTIVAD